MLRNIYLYDNNMVTSKVNAALFGVGKENGLHELKELNFEVGLY
jgi:hypothetical protein